jgi:hypothetical protein
MAPPTPTSSQPLQLELPLTVPSSGNLDELVSPLLLPFQIWCHLPPSVRAQCHQTLVTILQEVLHDAGPS